MKTDQQHVWRQLQEQGLVAGELPAVTNAESPWYVRLLLGISGWLAAVFLLGFIGTGFEFVFRNEIVAILLGTVMLVAAWFMLGKKDANDFGRQFALAVSFAGQALLTIGIFDLNETYDALNWLLLGLVQLGLAWFMPNNIHRVWSSLAAALALAYALGYGHIHFIQTGMVMAAVAIIWLYELDWLEWHDRLKPIGYGLTLALLCMGSANLFYGTLLDTLYDDNIKGVLDSPQAGKLLTGLVMFAVVWKLLKQYAVSQQLVIVTLAGTLLLMMASFEAGGITIGIVIILLGYANGNRILTSLGIASLLFYISVYYYMLHTTLLEKSKLLAVIGILLIAARLFMRHYLFREREVNHAQ